MWPFRRKTVLDAEAARWHLDNFAWLVRSFSKRPRTARTQLIVPGESCFVTNGETGHALALRLFGQVEAYGGFEEAGIGLAADDRASANATGSPAPSPAHGRHAIGTYSWGNSWNSRVNDNAPPIRYAPKLLADPQAFIAAMAHELAQRLLRESASHPPGRRGGEDEHLTDLAAVYLGFGVFLANSAFNIKTHANGWSYSRQGYLAEQDLVFALAIDLMVRRIDPAPALRYLKPHLAETLRRALGDLRPYRSEIDAMQAVDTEA